MKGRPRPTQFSHSRLWDSSKPSETERQSGVRSSAGSIPLSYSACPTSWITAQSAVPT